MSSNTRRVPVWRTLSNVALALGVVALGVTGVPSPALAAGTDIGGQLTNVELKMDPKNLGDLQQEFKKNVDLELNATVPSSAVAGDWWSVQYPIQFQDIPASYDIPNPDDPLDIWIEMRSEAATGKMKYTLTASGAAQRGFDFVSEFGAVYRALGAPGDHEITVGGPGGTPQVIGTVKITPGSGVNAQYPKTKAQKDFSFNQTSDQCQLENWGCLRVIIDLPAGNQGVLHFVDVAGDNWEFEPGDGPTYSMLKKRVYDGQGKVTLNLGAQPSEHDRVMEVIEFSKDRLEVKIDTSGLGNLEEYYLTFRVNAKYVTGGVPTTFTNEATVTTESQTWDIADDAKSAYIGGSASDKSIRIVKKDASGAEANKAEEAVSLPGTETGLVFTVMNSGSQPLTDLKVSDEVIAGGVVENLSCAFPGGSAGTEWAGPFAPKASFVCTALLTGVMGAHHNIARVEAWGPGAQTPEVAEDPFFAQGNPVIETAVLAKPDITAPECTVDTAGQTLWPTVAAPADSDSVEYGEVSVSDEQVATVTATAKAGFTFTGAELGTGWTLNDDGTATWSQQLESTVCDSQGVLAQPDITAPECTVDTAGQTLWPTVVAPADTDSVEYGEASVSDEQVATVTATAKAGFTFTGAELGTGWTLNDDGTATWSQQLESTVCDSQGVLAQPDITAPECTVDTAGQTLWPTVAAPADSDSVEYGEVAVSDEQVATVTATAKPGFTFTGAELGVGWTLNGDGTATWSQQLESTVCDSQGVLAQPDITVPECTADTVGQTLLPTVETPRIVTVLNTVKCP